MLGASLLNDMGKGTQESRQNNEGRKVVAGSRVKSKEICEVPPNYSSKGKFRQERKDATSGKKNIWAGRYLDLEPDRDRSTVCIGAVSSGSMLTEIARGRTIREVWGISSDNILRALGGLPETFVHCAALAEMALKAAIRDYKAYNSALRKKAL